MASILFFREISFFSSSSFRQQPKLHRLSLLNSGLDSVLHSSYRLAAAPRDILSFTSIPFGNISFRRSPAVSGRGSISHYVVHQRPSFKGSLIGHPVENIRICLTDGASLPVDSSELAFNVIQQQDL
ncbi:uncharacterized protein LOC133802497 isoform X2 [Humulus lupulus]|uniref:uncharacterized protein LOC133802497 isoform X2 n=1 Tax=Humulus lupulus TaxID=3486 RepID=UPI002B411F07|nr:uncharacterized protein LOC133802497 isoform X2 [Humulus lupulus]